MIKHVFLDSVLKFNIEKLQGLNNSAIISFWKLNYGLC